MSFKDHFSGHASDYARFRPTYPPQLFATLAALAPARELAWDAGTGSGQAALLLAAHFTRVLATDPSAQQIAQASPHRRVEYRAEPAERSSLDPASVDLITVAQALHWFDLERFYVEARRVLKPRGVLAAWCYGLTRLGGDIDPLVEEFYGTVVGPYWPAERAHIDSRYASLAFPFAELSLPGFEMAVEWTRDEFLGYLGTWSAVQRYRRERHEDPLAWIGQRLAPLWPAAGVRRRVSWPISLRAARVD